MKISKQLAIIALLISGQYLIAMEEESGFTQEIRSKGANLRHSGERTYETSEAQLQASEKGALARSGKTEIKMKINELRDEVKQLVNLTRIVEHPGEVPQFFKRLSFISVQLQTIDGLVENMVWQNGTRKRVPGPEAATIVDLIDLIVTKYTTWINESLKTVKNPASWGQDIKDEQRRAEKALTGLKKNKLALENR